MSGLDIFARISWVKHQAIIFSLGRGPRFGGKLFAPLFNSFAGSVKKIEGFKNGNFSTVYEQNTSGDSMGYFLGSEKIKPMSKQLEGFFSFLELLEILHLH